MKKFTIVFLFLFSIAVLACAQAPDCAQVQQRLDNAQKRLQDWAQLNRYADANTKLAAPAKGEQRVVFLGDSITDGWKLDQYFPGKPYVNRGISGQHTPEMLIRMRPDVIALKPRVVVILAGTNDLSQSMPLETIENNYQSLAELARANGIKLIFASVLPTSDYGAHPAWLGDKKMTETRPPEKIVALNKWLKEYCAANGCLYLDYFSRMIDDKGLLRAELADDGLHPNAAGYKIMAPLAEAAIGRALKGK